VPPEFHGVLRPGLSATVDVHVGETQARAAS
jgi:hypothetical protein